MASCTPARNVALVEAILQLTVDASHEDLKSASASKIVFGPEMHQYMRIA